MHNNDYVIQDIDLNRSFDSDFDLKDTNMERAKVVDE